MHVDSRGKVSVRVWHISAKERCHGTRPETFLITQYPGAPTAWGLMTCIAAKLAAYALGIQLNRGPDRPDHAFPTLIG